MTATRVVVACLVSGLMAGCDSGDPPPTAPGPDEVVASESQQAPLEQTGEFADRLALEVAFSVEGDLRPGTPLSLASTVRATRSGGSIDHWWKIEGGRPETGEVRRSIMSLQRGNQDSQSQVVTFDAPGYYRIVTRAELDDEDLVEQGLLKTAEATTWLLVTEDGSRVTDSFDPAVLSAHGAVEFGSVGAFVGRPFQGRLGSDREGLIAQTEEREGSTAQGRVSGPLLIPGAGMDGFFKYSDHDQSGDTVPLPGAEVDATCYGDPSGLPGGGYNDSHPVNTTVGSNGSFSVNCPTGYEYIEGYVRLRASNVYVAGPNNSAAGAFFSGYDSDVVHLVAANSYAAEVFNNLQNYIPEFAGSFGRTRSQVYVEASPSDTTFGIFYNPANDEIHTNYSRIFTDDGLWVTLHEYAHAFHRKAIEAPRYTGCTNGEHSYFEENLETCAFTEGLADWMAFWVADDVFLDLPYNGDSSLEYNGAHGIDLPLASEDGMRTEASFASFLWDLADDGSELDSPSNTADGDDDSYSVDASTIMDIIEACVLQKGSTYYYSLPTTEEAVYCFEGETTAYFEGSTYSSYWTPYTSVSFQNGVQHLDQQTVRSLWLYNFYEYLN